MASEKHFGPQSSFGRKNYAEFSSLLGRNREVPLPRTNQVSLILIHVIF